MKIVFTGPESSGKTSLATWYSSSHGFGFVPEVARHYLSFTDGTYTAENLREIGLLQRWEEFIGSKLSPNTVCDTDLLTILIWQEEKYGKYDQDFYQWWLSSKVDKYFLCAPDIPWESDPLRENPSDRDRLFVKYEQFLLSEKKDFLILKGTIDERKAIVLNTIDSLKHQYR